MSDNVKFLKYVLVEILVPALLIFGVIYGISLLIEGKYGEEVGLIAIPVLCTVLTMVVVVYEEMKR